MIDSDLIKEKAVDSIKLKGQYILMVSRFDLRTKDFVTLIDAYAFLDKAIRDQYQLVIVGDGPDFDVVKKYVEQSEVSDRVILPGRDINPFRWMSKSSVFVLSSLSEGFSMVLLEAMTLGIPVIASNCNVGPSDILDSGRYGMLFEPGNKEQLASSLTCMLSGEHELERYSHLAILRSEQFNIMSYKAMNGVFNG
jgi:glycosyltransferase involved in cell wall biosynthesis